MGERHGRQKYGLGKGLQHFFQYLSVSAGNVERCCVVISVLATDMDKVADEVGRRIESSLFDALGRVKKAIVPTRAEEVPKYFADGCSQVNL